MPKKPTINETCRCIVNLSKCIECTPEDILDLFAGVLIEEEKAERILDKILDGSYKPEFVI